MNKKLVVVLVLLLGACASPSPSRSPSKVVEKSQGASALERPTSNSLPKVSKTNSNPGGYYQDDGPGEIIPPDLASTVDPIPVVEPYSRTGNKPYEVFGQTYTPINDNVTPFKQRGVASWYGKKFHGKRTSSGEPYDMFKITAAHPLLPIPSYARVTNLSNGKQIIVRINDRGPFHSKRIMDLSYTAALKLDYLSKGSSEVELERLLPEDIAKMAENRQNQIAQNAKPLELKPVVVESSPSTVTSSSANSTNNVGSYFLQFAAYALRANAEAGMAQLKQSVEKTLNLLTLEIVEQGHLYRLQSGPYANRNEALAMAERLGAKALLIQR
ncbi:MAG: septal ring lytic transglycosylase RlpA family protein [Undibacterium sp.]|nr:septal ring lytic transglycosylase RlpA family protein [Undibacterium sp.]